MTARPDHPVNAKLPEVDAWRILLASRRSCRDFDGRPVSAELVRELIGDAIEAPSSCNHQNWHFVAVRDPDTRRRCAEVAAGNDHMRTCGALIYLCFQMGWTHDKFSIVQSVAAAASHILLGAHLRGLAAIWNAGIGDVDALRALLRIPPTFEVIGAVCIGHASPSFARLPKAPRRPVSEVLSFDHFTRPERSLYPSRGVGPRRYFETTNANSPTAEWAPDRWGWERIADFRGYAVWNKSPAPRVFEDDVFDHLMARLLALTADARVGRDVIDFMSWGGGSTVRLLASDGGERSITAVELSSGNLTFIEERLKTAGFSATSVTSFDLSAAGFQLDTLPQADVILAMHSLEYCPEPRAACAALARALRPGGTLAVLLRNRSAPRARMRWWAERRRQVSNRGPYRPLSPISVHKWLSRTGRVERVIGFHGEPSGRIREIEFGLHVTSMLAEHVILIARKPPIRGFREPSAQ